MHDVYDDYYMRNSICTYDETKKKGKETFFEGEKLQN